MGIGQWIIGHMALHSLSFTHATSVDISKNVGAAWRQYIAAEGQLSLYHSRPLDFVWSVYWDIAMGEAQPNKFITYAIWYVIRKAKTQFFENSRFETQFE